MKKLTIVVESLLHALPSEMNNAVMFLSVPSSEDSKMLCMFSYDDKHVFVVMCCPCYQMNKSMCGES